MSEPCVRACVADAWLLVPGSCGSQAANGQFDLSSFLSAVGLRDRQVCRERPSVGRQHRAKGVCRRGLAARGHARGNGRQSRGKRLVRFELFQDNAFHKTMHWQRVLTWARSDSRFASRHYTFTFHAQIPAIHGKIHVLNAAFSAPKRLKIVAKRLKSPEFCTPSPDRPRLVVKQMILKKIR